MNELIIVKDPAVVVVVADPFNPDIHHEDPQSIIESIARKVRPFRDGFMQLVDIGGLENVETKRLKDTKREAEETSKKLLDWTKKASEAALAAVGMTAVVTQIAGKGRLIDPLSFRGLLADTVKQCDEEQAARKCEAVTGGRCGRVNFVKRVA